MRDILQRAYQGTGVEYTARITESALAVLHFVVLTPGRSVPEVDPGALEAQLAGAARSWTDDLREALLDSAGEELGAARFARFGTGFPAAYRDEWTVVEAADDVARLDALGEVDLSMALYPDDAREGAWGLKLYRSGSGIALSDILPILERVGMTVVDERPYVVPSSDGVERWIYDFRLGLSERATHTVASHPQPVLDGLAAVWAGRADNDGLNRLMTEAGLQWREVALLRTYRKYLRQTGTTFSQSYIERCLATRPELVRLLLALFDARFNPDRPLDASESRQADIDALAVQVDAGLDLVDSLDEDRILRGFVRLVQATMRTNFYQRDEEGQPRAVVAVKLDPRSLPDLPAPRPHHEVFVHSPRVEGVHLRGGDVARGGLRWSDRPEDFRTEILGLMKAQLVKNAVIVPVGAKGGFVVRRPPATGGRDALQEEAVACYRELVSSLLDLTDNLVEGRTVHPPRTLCYDGDDSYLVVAADKGTATFSDIANQLAVDRGYWLGDAFASGGSTGYDHKRMGITARGAWESVKRHFGELGIDVQSTPVTAVGIGDMSGDVFGNGMLLSEHLELVAAFDHRHVFLDPAPDPAVGFAERRRLFELPRSSWDDYDRTLISTGGGVFPRTAKSIRLSPEAQAALGIDDEALAPPDLVRAVLCAPVDLLWNGGIGTYVKAATEANSDVGDKANDAVRVDGADLRCRVVGEGGNLGFTQRGRVEYALAGGRIFTDSIDNSAGVDCSDHEVNIKILVDSVVRDGVIDVAARNELLVEMTDDVAAHVLRDNEANTEALAIAGRQAPSLAEVHARYLDSLEHDGVLDRALEFLPTTKDIEQRRANGAGLTPPELAILLAYTKVDLDRALLASGLPDDPFVAPQLFDYFPGTVRDRYPEHIERHPLRREILATRLSNEVVNRGGTTFLYRLADESQASLDAIAGAHLASSAIFAVTELWPRVRVLVGHVDPDVQVDMLLRARRLAERGTRWLLRSGEPLDLSATVERLRPGVEQVRRRLEEFVVGDDFDRIRATTAELRAAGVPADVAGDVAKLDVMVVAPDLVELAASTGADLALVASVYFTLGERLRFGWLRDQIVALPRDDRWRSLARTSLLGDLLARQRAIVERVLTASAGGGPGDPGDPHAAIDGWTAAHPGPVDRYLQLVGDIGASDPPDLAVLSVTLRVVQTLAEAGPTGPTTSG
jgi:glutamate dehydrogenase